MLHVKLQVVHNARENETNVIMAYNEEIESTLAQMFIENQKKKIVQLCLRWRWLM
ncbi:hypothetical protein SK128_023968, partial [Halocaridina rubra]